VAVPRSGGCERNHVVALVSGDRNGALRMGFSFFSFFCTS